MDVEFLIEQEIAITDLIRQVKVEIAEGKESIRPPSQLDGTEGRLSRQDSMLRHELEKATQRERQKSLGRLEEALVRIDDGVYGRCEGCGKEIAKERLAIMPEATLCGICLGHGKR